MPKKAGHHWRKDHDTDHSRLQRNYTATEEMLHELRGDADFSEHAQHDSNELRPAAHHNYNEAALEDAAFQTNLHGHGRRRSSARASSRRTPSRSPGRRTAKSLPKSPSPAPPAKRVRNQSQAESADNIQRNAKQSNGSTRWPEIWPWIYIGGCAAVGGSWIVAMLT